MFSVESPTVALHDNLLSSFADALDQFIRWERSRTPEGWTVDDAILRARLRKGLVADLTTGLVPDLKSAYSTGLHIQVCETDVSCGIRHEAFLVALAPGGLVVRTNVAPERMTVLLGHHRVSGRTMGSAGDVHFLILDAKERHVERFLDGVAIAYHQHQ